MIDCTCMTSSCTFLNGATHQTQGHKRRVFGWLPSHELESNLVLKRHAPGSKCLGAEPETSAGWSGPVDPTQDPLHAKYLCRTSHVLSAFNFETAHCDTQWEASKLMWVWFSPSPHSREGTLRGRVCVTSMKIWIKGNWLAVKKPLKKSQTQKESGKPIITQEEKNPKKPKTNPQKQVDRALMRVPWFVISSHRHLILLTGEEVEVGV